MRFAITATDRYLNIMQAFLGRGWTPVKLFTTPVDQRVHRNKEVIELAQKLKVDVQLSRLSQEIYGSLPIAAARRSSSRVTHGALVTGAPI